MREFVLLEMFGKRRVALFARGPDIWRPIVERLLAGLKVANNQHRRIMLARTYARLRSNLQHPTVAPMVRLRYRLKLQRTPSGLNSFICSDYLFPRGKFKTTNVL